MRSLFISLCIALFPLTGTAEGNAPRTRYDVIKAMGAPHQKTEFESHRRVEWRYGLEKIVFIDGIEQRVPQVVKEDPFNVSISPVKSSRSSSSRKISAAVMNEIISSLPDEVPGASSASAPGGPIINPPDLEMKE